MAATPFILRAWSNIDSALSTQQLTESNWWSTGRRVHHNLVNRCHAGADRQCVLRDTVHCHKEHSVQLQWVITTRVLSISPWHHGSHVEVDPFTLILSTPTVHWVSMITCVLKSVLIYTGHCNRLLSFHYLGNYTVIMQNFVCIDHLWLWKSEHALSKKLHFSLKQYEYCLANEKPHTVPAFQWAVALTLRHFWPHPHHLHKHRAQTKPHCTHSPNTGCVSFIKFVFE